MELVIFERHAGESGSAYVYRVLKHNIVYYKLAPGAQINETELTALLGVSRTPVREALLKLKNEHLVDIKPQSGTKVSLIDGRAAMEAKFIRHDLEPRVYLEASDRITEEGLQRLRENLQLQKLAIQAPVNYVRFNELDDEFHRMAYEIAGRLLTWEIISSVSASNDRIRYLSVISRDINAQKSYEIHTAIFSALEQRDRAALTELVRDHTMGGEETTPENKLARLLAYIPGLREQVTNI